MKTRTLGIIVIIVVVVVAIGAYVATISPSAPVTPTPTMKPVKISLSPTSGHVGTKIILTGTGLQPKGNYSVRYGGNEVATATADENGNIQVSFNVPKGAAGDYNITTFPASTTQVFTVVPLKVALVLDVPKDDYGWGNNAYQGLIKVRDELGAQVTFSESTALTDLETATREFAAAGNNLVILEGAEMQDAATAVAKQYPNVKFMVIMGYESAPNMAGYDISNHEAGYLAGALAGLMTKTGTIGGIYCWPTSALVRIIEAFKLGARAVNPSVKVLDTCLFNWWDPALGREAALAQIEKGADIIIHGLSNAVIGVVGASVEHFTYMIGKTVDQNSLGPNTFLTSVIENCELAVYKAAESVLDGTFEGKVYQLGIGTGFTDIAPYHAFEKIIPDNVKAKIAQMRQDIISGKLVVPSITTSTGSWLE